MLMIRTPSSTGSSRARSRASAAHMRPGLGARDPAEHAADRHPDAREIAFAQHVPCHDLAGRVDVLGLGSVPHQYLRSLVYRYAEVGEGDSGAQRIGAIRRDIDSTRPMRLVRLESDRAAPVEGRRIEGSGLRGPVEAVYFFNQDVAGNPELLRELPDRGG